MIRKPASTHQSAHATSPDVWNTRKVRLRGTLVLWGLLITWAAFLLCVFAPGTEALADDDGEPHHGNRQVTQEPSPATPAAKSPRLAPRVRARGPRLPVGTVAHLNVPYCGSHEDPRKLDIYVPREAAKKLLPLVVWVHGGGWQNGDKRHAPVHLLSQGYIVASINYRLSSDAVFPAQLEDCKTAIRFLRANAPRFRINGERIGVWGASAGGHLAALLGTTGDVDDFVGTCRHSETSSQVQAVCDFFGPTDFLQMDAHALPDAPFQHDDAESPESKLIGGAIQEHPEKVARANPITYVSPGDPPFLIVHGDEDPLVPSHQSQLLHDALQAAMVPVTLEIIKGAGHGFSGRPEINPMVIKFFDQHLKRGELDAEVER